MIIYLCIKYESNILIFSKDNELKPVFNPAIQLIVVVVVVVALLFYVHGKHLRSCQDGQLI